MKKVLKYSLRVVLFIVIGSLLYVKAQEFIYNTLSSIYGFMYPDTREGDYSVFELIMSIFAGAIIIISSTIGITYFFAKICGLFKSLDGIKKWKSILILILISIFIVKFSDFLDKYKDIVALDIRIGISFSGLGLVPSYLTYLFLNRMTQKHPKYLTKIGYYTSIEFFKDLKQKIYQKS